MAEEPSHGVATPALLATLNNRGFDTDYYRWCDDSVAWGARSHGADPEDSLLTPQGSFAPLDVGEFIRAFEEAGAEVRRAGRTAVFRVSVFADTVEVALLCRRGRGINTLSPLLSVATHGEERERSVPLSSVARDLFLAQNPSSEDPLYPYPIISSRSHLDVFARELTDWMRRIAETYSR